MTEKKTRRGGPRDGLFKRGGCWWLDYYDADGRRHREKAAPSYEIAKLMYRDKKNAIAKGELLGVRGESMSVRTFIDTVYWPVVQPTLQVDWATRSREILEQISATFGSRPIAKLTADEIAGWTASGSERSRPRRPTRNWPGCGTSSPVRSTGST
jgi:hypothetical protein